jgi:tetratricopeptide (TPR) repeat protein
MGRHDEAKSFATRARALDPLYSMTFALSAQISFQAGDYTAAEEFARQAIALDSEFWIAYMQRGQALERLGQPDLALEALNAAARFSGHNSKPISLRGYVLARMKRHTDAREVLNVLETTSQQRHVPPYAFALIHAGLGDRDAVFAWLERAYDARDVHLVFLPVDAKWDPFRTDPRFQALIKRCFGGASNPATASPPPVQPDRTTTR